jgi:uncharacterized protein
VGGGIIVVPLLIALLAYDAKPATATSLAGIIITAGAGAVAYAALGNVHWLDAVLVGIPAMVGLTIGLAIKDRVTSRALTLAFCALLVGVAISLAVR